MKLNLPKITFGDIGQSLIKHSYLITILLIITGLALIFWFLYRQVYQTLTQAEILTDLKKSVPGEIINRDDFTQTLSDIEQKKSRPALTNELIGRNPFVQSTTSVPVLAPASTTASSTPSTTTTTLAP